VQTVVLLATGGTIATRTGPDGKAVADAAGAELLAGLPLPRDVRVEVDDVFRVGSYLMSLERLHELALRAQHHLRNREVAGLVVTHGTDTAEETALFMDLVLDDPRPVVVTGAQRPRGALASDSPRNLCDAIAVAACTACRGLGTTVVFDGSVFPAWGTRKSHTLASGTFAAPDSGPLGWVHEGNVHIEARLRPRPRLDLSALDLSRVRVDIAACYPGADAAALCAFAAAGARGIVLEATGAGNANPAICEAVAELTGAGVVVATSTRVNAGTVAAIYGNGGGADLLEAGAVPAGLLRPPQARILLAALLGTHDDPKAVRDALAAYTAG
jgi:L-asparaginase